MPTSCTCIWRISRQAHCEADRSGTACGRRVLAPLRVLGPAPVPGCDIVSLVLTALCCRTLAPRGFWQQQLLQTPRNFFLIPDLVTHSEPFGRGRINPSRGFKTVSRRRPRRDC
jgi:hypothetical protein